jgi:hypothetical protein
MTALLLSAAGAALGAAAGPLGAMAGRLAGAVLGASLDQRLFGRAGQRHVEGPRLSDLDVQASSEGAPIPQVYGRARISGQIVWATRFEEVATTTRESGGAKGAPRPSGSTTTYSYFANFAVALCEGPIAHVGRVWADGKPLDLATVTMRVHRGAEDQPPDPLIEAKEGAGATPAYRGTAYVVFERLALSGFGNRLPQLAFEVVRPVGRLERQVRAVCVIPGATEFGYGTTAVARDAGFGAGATENRNSGAPGTDFTASLSELLRVCPNLDKVALVVGWFGDDLRAGVCEVRPGVDLAAKATTVEWRVGGIARAAAREVSRIAGRAAYGGTPSDASVLEAIASLKARGIAVTLIPFLFMDVPPGNGRPDPWTGAADQPVLPWRGRIICDPAPGRPGTPDGTAAVTAEVDAFFGAAAHGDFAVAAGEVTYSGPDEWSYRRFVLHYAHLAALAGGVECFLLGSEMVGLTRLRSARRAFPAAEALASLAVEVKALLGPSTLVTYGADWTEYGGYVPPGTSDLVFPLDRLWASPAIDRVGIDWYPPLGD